MTETKTCSHSNYSEDHMRHEWRGWKDFDAKSRHIVTYACPGWSFPVTPTRAPKPSLVHIQVREGTLDTPLAFRIQCASCSYSIMESQSDFNISWVNDMIARHYEEKHNVD